ncbi:MAG: hypothetical protein ACOCYW_09265 [Roseicyclus sp.]
MPAVTWRRDWWTKVTTRHLPMGGVGVPRVMSERIAISDVTRSTDVIVVLKRAGTETIEDDLWSDAESIETTVLPVLGQHSDDYDLAETQVSVDAGGDEPIGELSMLFRAVLRTAEGNPSTLI